MYKREAKFGILFRHWLKANPRFSCAFELKQTQGGTIPFNCLEEAQIDYLQAVKSNRGVLIRTQGGNGEPDYIYLRDFPANVVILFPSAFYLIDIDVFVHEKEQDKRGLSAERAAQIALVSVPL